MASDTSDFILPLGDPQDEDTSDKVVEVMPKSQVANKKKRSAKAKSTNTGNEITTKSQAKTSWVWNYFVKKHDDKGEMRAYCQFVINDEKCTKSYKHDGSTG